MGSQDLILNFYLDNRQKKSQWSLIRGAGVGSLLLIVKLNGEKISQLSDFPNSAGHHLIQAYSPGGHLENLSWVKSRDKCCQVFLPGRFERNFTVILMLGNLQCFSILAANFMPHFMPNLLSVQAGMRQHFDQFI